MQLSIEPEESMDMQNSIYSEFGPDGLRFLKDGIKVSKEGLSKVTMLNGNKTNHEQLINLNDLESSGNKIGGGAAAQVEEGIYKPLNIKVAIKKINVYDREKRHQLMNDIKILLQNKIKQERNNTNCNFIVNLYGAFYDQGVVKVVLELMDVGSLNDIINIFKMTQIQQQPQIPEPIIAKICQQILNGLMYLHVVGKQVHRDIKPANILMNSKGEVKLTDFGISKELEETQQYCVSFLGTKAYMSPERIEGKQYNNKSDIWSLGLILYELATGQYPYREKTTFIELLQLVVNEESPKLPDDGTYSPQFQDFISLCLQKNQNKRASSIELLGHPWILDNISSDMEIADWLQEIKSNLMQQQQFQQHPQKNHNQNNTNHNQQNQNQNKQQQQQFVQDQNQEQFQQQQQPQFQLDNENFQNQNQNYQDNSNYNFNDQQYNQNNQNQYFDNQQQQFQQENFQNNNIQYQNNDFQMQFQPNNNFDQDFNQEYSQQDFQQNQNQQQQYNNNNYE